MNTHRGIKSEGRMVLWYIMGQVQVTSGLQGDVIANFWDLRTSNMHCWGSRT